MGVTIALFSYFLLSWVLFLFSFLSLSSAAWLDGFGLVMDTDNEFHGYGFELPSLFDADFGSMVMVMDSDKRYRYWILM